jgi:hypothetical protein
MLEQEARRSVTMCILATLGCEVDDTFLAVDTMVRGPAAAIMPPVA